MATIDGKPDGYTTLTPFLVCQPAADAIDFYVDVFGATVVAPPALVLLVGLIAALWRRRSPA